MVAIRLAVAAAPRQIPPSRTLDTEFEFKMPASSKTRNCMLVALSLLSITPVAAFAADKPKTAAATPQNQTVTQTINSVPQLCRIREGQIIKFAAAVNQKEREVAAERDKARQTQLNSELQSYSQGLGLLEISWNRMECASILYPNGVTPSAAAPTPAAPASR